MQAKDRLAAGEDWERSAGVVAGERPGTGVQGRERPLLMADIDGVISLFGGGRRFGMATSADAQATGAQHEGHEIAGSFHSIDGMFHFLSATAAAHLLELSRDHYELVWASGWEERANEHLPHLLGLPRDVPFLRFARAVGRANAHWKLQAIDAYAGTRALAWIDDALNEACHEWARARQAPTLLVQTEPQHGLTAREAARLIGWAASLRAPERAPGAWAPAAGEAFAT